MADYASYWLSSQLVTPAAVSVLLVTMAISILAYIRMSSSEKDWTKELATSKVSAPRKDQQPLMSIWEGRRQNGDVSSSNLRVAKKDRPFGSSYYYAHNDPNAKGGYSDGLRMEDFTMNQPRLLSKSGSVTEEDFKDSDPVESQNSMPPPTKKLLPRDDRTSVKRMIPRDEAIPITKYLWDDPGEANGIATIRIDNLPAVGGGDPSVTWKGAQITDISANLVDHMKGLLVLLQSEDGNKYRLHIPKLYGDVEAVRTLSKPKRLLVRLYKKKPLLGIGDKSNLKAWPHPYKKTAT